MEEGIDNRGEHRRPVPGTRPRFRDNRIRAAELVGEPLEEVVDGSQGVLAALQDLGGQVAAGLRQLDGICHVSSEGERQLASDKAGGVCEGDLEEGRLCGYDGAAVGL